MKLGDKVKDKITGFSGTVVAKHEYLNGCVRLTVQPNTLKNGKPIEPETFDVEQMTLVKADQHKPMTRSGGPERTPARTAVPRR